jgi:ketose-bisphosphate aldolase
MAIQPLKEMLSQAARRGYAVGYFECWDLESLLAVSDAAQEMNSPVLVGFSGIYLPHPERIGRGALEIYAAMGLAVCRTMKTPANLVFNESPDEGWVMQAIHCGFGQVMYTDDRLEPAALVEKVREISEFAHQHGVAVEGELAAVPGLAGGLEEVPRDLRLTDPQEARHFVEITGIDALAVNIGQAHLHGRQTVSLDFGRLAEIKKAVAVPLVLHGASSIGLADLRCAVEMGIAKVNVGSRLKQAYIEAMRVKLLAVEANHNPYEVIGSGLEQDVLLAGRLAMKQIVAEYMDVFGSAGKA